MSQKLVMNKTKALVPLEGGALRRRSRGARPSIIGRSRLLGVRQRNLRHRRTKGMGMEPAGLQPKSRQQRLFAGGARFRARGAAHSEFAQTPGGNSRRHRSSQDQLETFAQDPYRDRDRADPGRNFVSARGPFAFAQSSDASGKRPGTHPGKNGERARRLQDVVAKRFAP